MLKWSVATAVVAMVGGIGLCVCVWGRGLLLCNFSKLEKNHLKFQMKGVYLAPFRRFKEFARTQLTTVIETNLPH